MNYRYISLACVGLVLMNPMKILATEGKQIDYASMEKQESEEFKQISPTFQVESEGVSSYYYNTTIYGVRYGEKDVITSTQDVPALGEDMCVGRPLDNNEDNTQYACVVLPESLADEYGRGDIVYVAYDSVDKDGYAVIPCVVIDFNQTEHGNSLNFVGEFTYNENDVAWLVEGK